MKCTNCGKKLKGKSQKCPECGAEISVPEKKDDEVSISTAIATVLVIIFITCAVIGFYFAYGKDKLTESNMRRQLMNNSGEIIIEMYFDDFNGDGTKEAYAVTGSGSAKNILTGSIWYMRDGSGVNVKSGFKGSLNGMIVEKGQKYISVEVVDEDGTSSSYICGVNQNGDHCTSPASEKFSNVHQADGRILTETGKEISILSSEN